MYLVLLRCTYSSEVLEHDKKQSGYSGIFSSVLLLISLDTLPLTPDQILVAQDARDTRAHFVLNRQVLDPQCFFNGHLIFSILLPKELE